MNSPRAGNSLRHEWQTRMKYIHALPLPPPRPFKCGGNDVHARTQICLMLENINSLKFNSPSHRKLTPCRLLIMLLMPAIPECGAAERERGRRKFNYAPREQAANSHLLYKLNISLFNKHSCLWRKFPRCHLLTMISLGYRLTANC